jgi:hypothetical protein
VYADDPGVSVCVRDAADRRRRQQVADSPELMDSVLDVAPMAVVVMQPDGSILRASRRWTRTVEAMTGPASATRDGASYFTAIERTASPDAARQLRERIDALRGPA